MPCHPSHILPITVITSMTITTITTIPTPTARNRLLHDPPHSHPRTITNSTLWHCRSYPTSRNSSSPSSDRGGTHPTSSTRSCSTVRGPSPDFTFRYASRPLGCDRRTKRTKRRILLQPQGQGRTSSCWIGSGFCRISRRRCVVCSVLYGGCFSGIISCRLLGINCPIG